MFPSCRILTLSGPPESMREHVVAASKAMKMGDWKTCHSFIINEKMNGKVWDLFPEADKVRIILVRKIQEDSLRTYLFTYTGVYDSISMEKLSDMFELDLPTVHSIISKMIINEELMVRARGGRLKIGRASWRERVYVLV